MRYKLAPTFEDDRQWLEQLRRSVYRDLFFATWGNWDEVRAPAHDGHDSGVMADSVPAARRTLFRPDGGQFGVRSGKVSAMPGMPLP